MREDRVRVCNVLEEGQFGGPQSRVVLVAEALVEHGIDTHVLYSNYNSKRLAEQLAKKGISSSGIQLTAPTKKRSRLIRYLLLFPAEILMLAWSFYRGRYDVVHVNGPQQVKGAIAARLAGVPLVWHLNDTLDIRPIKVAFSAIARRCATGFIVAGQRVYENYLSGTVLEGRPCAEIHAPVDMERFDPSRVEADERLCGRGGLRILTLSNINPTKGIDEYIEMAAEMGGRHPDLRFYIGGAVYASQQLYYERLQGLIATNAIRNIEFLGRVDDVPAALKAADIFVFLSRAEASPTAVWEAMAMERSVVSTDVGSVSQHIEDGVSGFIVPVGNKRALIERVELLLKDAALRERMGRAARAAAQGRLGVSPAAQKHAEIYRRALAANQSH
jgi:glycosyltransferase involved in cell wall biosynthesis